MFHKQTKCSKLTRDTVDNIMKSQTPMWTCNKCLESQERDYNKVEQTGTHISETVVGTSNQSLKIMQWNADGLNTKISELRSRLKEENIDICNIQETKLQPHMPTPKIPGYKPTKRADRKGGLTG